MNDWMSLCGGQVMKGWTRTRSLIVDLEGVVTEIAETLKSYRLSSVTGDRYAGHWVRQAFQAQGIRYEEAQPKAEAYLELEPLFAQGRIEILDHPQLIRELKTLERRPRAGGKILVDHPRGGHDDYANALALAAAKSMRSLTLVGFPIGVGEGASYWGSANPSGRLTRSRW